MGITYDIKTYFRENTSVNEKNVPNKALMKFIQDYKAKNVDFFSSNGLTNCPTFGAEYKRQILGTLGLEEPEYLDFIKKSKNVDHTLKESTNSVYVGLLLSASMDKRLTKSYLEFLSFIMYSSKYVKYWKYGSKQVVMDELFDNHLDNNSDIFKYKIIDKVLEEKTKTLMSHFGNDIHRCCDRDILLILNSISTRINLLLRSISEKYYKLDKTDSVTFVEKSIMSEDEYITVNTNSNRLDNLMSKFKDEELKHGISLKVYNIVDKKHEYYTEMEQLYRAHIVKVYNLLSAMINCFLSKRDNKIETFKAHFASDVYDNKIKSKQITDIHEDIARLLNIPNSKSAIFRTILERYIALRIRQISREV